MNLSKKRIALAVSAGLLALSSQAYAAQPSQDDLLKQIQSLKTSLETLQKQVQAQSHEQEKLKEAIPQGAELVTQDDLNGLRSNLEDYKYDQQRLRDFNSAVTDRGLKIKGTVALQYTGSSVESSNSSVRPNANTQNGFGTSSATLGFSGNLFKDYDEGKNWDYAVGFSFGSPKFANGAASTNSPTPGDSTVKLTDAYIQRSLLKSNGGLEDPKLTVTIGQQKLPFGLAAQVSDELQPTVSTGNAQFLAGLGNINTRQNGVVFRGDLFPEVDFGVSYRAPLLEYALGVFNGNGDNRTDDNNRRDYIARLATYLPVDFNHPLRGLSFGTTYLQGSANVYGNNTTSAVTSNTATNLIRNDGNYTRRGFDIQYNHNPYGLTFEVAKGEQDVGIGSLTTKANTGHYVYRESLGKTLTLFYNFGDIAQWSANLNKTGKLDDFWPTTSQVYYRIDRWDPTTGVHGDESVKYTIGYNYYFAQTTKLQLGLTRTIYPGAANLGSSATTTALGLTNQVNKVPDNAITALFQYGF
ncbi:MAG: hypothetical protein RIR18_2446 [Pseudomonadota bacterium]